MKTHCKTLIVFALCAILPSCGDGDPGETERQQAIRSYLESRGQTGVTEAAPGPVNSEAKELAAAKPMDLTGDRSLARHFRVVEASLYKPQPTTLVTVEELDGRVRYFRIQLARQMPNEPAHDASRRAAVAAVKRFERKILQMYLVWSEQRTLATLRGEWEILRERHFRASETSRSTPELDAAQGIREPAANHDIFEGIRRAEEILRHIEELHREVQTRPEDERYDRFSDTVGPYYRTIQPWMRHPRLRLPDGALKQARSAWMKLDTTRSTVSGVLTVPWESEFRLGAPRAVAGERRTLRELRLRLEAYFDEVPADAI